MIYQIIINQAPHFSNRKRQLFSQSKPFKNKDIKLGMTLSRNQQMKDFLSVYKKNN